MTNELITEENKARAKKILEEARQRKGPAQSQYELLKGYVDLVEEYQAEGLELRDIYESLKKAEPRLTVSEKTFKIYVQRARREARKKQEGDRHDA